MLERYGITQQPDETLHIDIPRAIEQVQTELVEVFRFRPHVAIIQFLETLQSGELLRRILELRGIAADEIEATIDAYTLGRQTGAAYVGDLDVELRPKPDYLVFVPRTTRIAYFPFFLAEEMTHGEHIATIIDREQITYAQYRQRFHELTDELLGYLGRKRVVQNAGLAGSYQTTVPYNDPMTESNVAHMIAYYAVDELVDAGKRLPDTNLFHAADEKSLWRILFENTGEPVHLNFAFPPHVRYENRFAPRVQELLREARAEQALKVTFSYQKR